jgi:hypothetical protein
VALLHPRCVRLSRRGCDVDYDHYDHDADDDCKVAHGDEARDDGRPTARIYDDDGGSDDHDDRVDDD